MLHSSHEGLKSLEMTGFHFVQPLLKPFSAELTHHLQKFFDQLIGRFQVRACLPQLSEGLLLLCFQIFFFAEKEPGGLGRGESQEGMGLAFGL